VARIEAGLARRLVEAVALARKAGQAVAGLEKTRAALMSGKAALLLQAADGSARGRTALRPPPGENTRVSCLLAHELGLAFGRDSVIHAAVLAGGLADRVRDEALRLSGIRADGQGGAARRADDVTGSETGGARPRAARQTGFAAAAVEGAQDRGDDVAGDRPREERQTTE
jgi:hypothetical protein